MMGRWHIPMCDNLNVFLAYVFVRTVRYARGTTIHMHVKHFVLADFCYIYYVAQQLYSIYPASQYTTCCLASIWQPVVHNGFSAAGQLVTLVYRGKIND